VVALFIGPQRERRGRSAGINRGGGVIHGGWPLRGGEWEVAGQRQFNGETGGGDSTL
jgi:hypothetical protein